MSKETIKKCKNPVGAGPVSARNNKGITLISLVITIIVMLILVGVTVSVALNGGLFNTAKKAVDETEILQEKELIERAFILSEMGSGVQEQRFRTCLEDEAGAENIELSAFGDEFEVYFKQSKRYYPVDKYGEIGDYQTAIEISNAGDITKGGALDGIEKPYEINCIEDLVALSYNTGGIQVQEDGTLGTRTSTTYSGKQIILTRDLNFKSKYSYENAGRTDYGDVNGNGTVESLITELTTENGFLPIKNFLGNFDGQENELKNIYINRVDGAALFNSAKEIKNLSISGNITSASNWAAGFYNGIGDVIIKNCKNYANITGYHFVGGIFSGNQKEIEYNISDCINYGTITITGGSNAHNAAGGICGYISSITITNCINEGDIIGEQYIGGIIGEVGGNGQINIINSINRGKCKNGILGWHRSGKTNIINCGNYGECTNGFVGQLSGSGWTAELELNIKNSYNLGKTTNGILGTQGTICLKNTLNIENCYSAGESEKAIIGSVSTSSKTTTITNITNTYYDTTKSTSMGFASEGITGVDTIKNNANLLNILNSNIGENADWNTWRLGEDGYPKSTTI